MKGNIVILTGAGISAESGVPTFRASDGLWCGHRVEDVATPEGFRANPDLVQDFYNQRRRQLREVAPNAAHHALARLAAEWPNEVLLVTQNVDDLHDRARLAVEQGLPSAQAGVGDVSPPPRRHERSELAVRDKNELIHMHGELLKSRCTRTGQVCTWSEDILPDTVSPFHPDATLRPHIVWFGEMPLRMDRIEQALGDCALFISIGTSGNVYPAAGFVSAARHAGAHTVELNLEPSLGQNLFHEHHYGPATQVVPEFVERLLA
jgi:NAD-dependent deacetylase